MFRIHFDHRNGMFIAQVHWFHLLWRNVYREISGENGAVRVVRSWTTYTEAREWIESIGLNELYDEQHPKSYRQFVLGGATR